MIADDIRICQTFDPTGENGGYRCETGLEDKPEQGGVSAALDVADGVSGFTRAISDALVHNRAFAGRLHGTKTGRWRDTSIGQIVEKGALTHQSSLYQWIIQSRRADKAWEVPGQDQDRLRRNSMVENPCGEVVLSNFANEGNNGTFDYSRAEKRILDYCKADAEISRVLEEKMRAVHTDMEDALSAALRGDELRSVMEQAPSVEDAQDAAEKQWNEMLRIEG